ncbi:Fatty acid amide hydrolase [Thelohanellus kitauei]|uniref:Fatty acid amide hydrolase n=1 Tax=Thelohanellus kitauei TaxID=669202 RepID=A0A0C2J9C4_THEKT|nr:Fatty acid amide hydrolase [Thelohanellus kitauei]
MSQSREVGRFIPTRDATAMFQKSKIQTEISGVKAAILWHCLGKYTKKSLTLLLKRLANLEVIQKLDIEDLPTDFPIRKPMESPEAKNIDMEAIFGAKEIWPYLTIRDYREAYLFKQTTPTAVAKKIIDLCHGETIKSYNATVEIRPDEVLEAAKQSTARYDEGKSLSVLDGVPFFVKEHIKIVKASMN